MTNEQLKKNLVEKVARELSEFKDWDGAREGIKDGWRNRAKQILSLWPKVLSEGKRHLCDDCDIKEACGKSELAEEKIGDIELEGLSVDYKIWECPHFSQATVKEQK